MIEATIAYLILAFLSYILVLPIVKDRIYRRYLPKHEGGRYLMLISSHVMTVFFFANSVSVHCSWNLAGCGKA
jgi:hypothetical protein